MGDSLPLLKGTLDLLLLKALESGPRHGYGLASWLEARSGGTLGVEDSALYQALHRMEERAWVEAEWGVTDNNRRARYYTLTGQGRKHLMAESEQWARYVASVGAILAVDVGGGE